MNNQSVNDKMMAMANPTENKKTSGGEDIPFNTRKSDAPTPSAQPIKTVINRQIRRSKSDGDAGACGWRTYAQVKQSEAAKVKRCNYMNTGAHYQGYKTVMPHSQHHQQSERGQHNPDTFIRSPFYEQKSGSFMKAEFEEQIPDRFMKPQYAEQKYDLFMKPQEPKHRHDLFMKPRMEKVSPQMKEGTDAKANAANVQGWMSGGNLQPVVKRRGIETCPPSYGPFDTVEYGPAPSQDKIAQMYEGMLWSGMVDNRIPPSKVSEDCEKYANDHSPGSFVMTDSKYGNSLMPALPRM